MFLPRHGRGHPTSPTHLNYRANIDALKRSGVTDVLSLSAVGSLKAELPPGPLRGGGSVYRSQLRAREKLLRRRYRRPRIHGPSGVRSTGRCVVCSGRALSLPVTRGGTYLVMEGPQFSTKAESELYRSWGCSVIGMTNMPEAKLAREAELCYATVAMVTDFDCWHPDHDHVTVEAVVKVLLGNADHARSLVKAVVPDLGPGTDSLPLRL